MRATPRETQQLFFFGADRLGQPVLDILAEMIAYDGSLRIGTSYTGPVGVDVAELMREMGSAQGVGLD